ncbi:glycosyltransferase [Kocuria sp. CPCC 205268]|uniref:glycosyltransferase family 4 protein n=1 Tax=Kocuria oxytropis TaxID=3058913 RepID=UPI0034D56874
MQEPATAKHLTVSFAGYNHTKWALTARIYQVLYISVAEPISKITGRKYILQTGRSPYAMFLAVLPSYRTNCIEILKSQFGNRLSIEVSSAHLDPTVKTGIRPSLFRAVPMVRFGKKAFMQVPLSLNPLLADNLVVDLNPRSITSWALLVMRRLLGRRTLVWGHLHPQAGGSVRTAMLRRTMRRLARGTISYTHIDRTAALEEIPHQPVWVAPNAIYMAKDIRPGDNTGAVRNAVIYVGRFQPQKKVALLVRGFAEARKLKPEMRLILVGGGVQEQNIRELVTELSICGDVELAGWVEDVSQLRSLYDRAFASASPGFAGLGLTQSLGFGVPMVIAKDEPHSPEIELAQGGPVTWFETDSPSDLAAALVRLWDCRGTLPDENASDLVRSRYSAESMAAGLADALQGLQRKEE